MHSTLVNGWDTLAPNLPLLQCLPRQPVLPHEHQQLQVGRRQDLVRGTHHSGMRVASVLRTCALSNLCCVLVFFCFLLRPLLKNQPVCCVLVPSAYCAYAPYADSSDPCITVLIVKCVSWIFPVCADTSCASRILYHMQLRMYVQYGHNNIKILIL